MFAPYLQLPGLVYILCLGTFINRAGTLLIPFLTIYMKEQLGQRVEFATLTMGAFGLGSVVGQTLGGHFADRVGRRAVMLTSLFSGASVMVLLAFARTAPLFLAGVFLLAVVGEMLRPAVQAMMADIVPPLQRQYSFAVLFVSINLGFACGPMIGGLLAEHAFQAIFFVDAATSCAYGLIVVFFVPETLPTRRAHSTTPAPVNGAADTSRAGDARAADAKPAAAGAPPGASVAHTTAAPPRADDASHTDSAARGPGFAAALRIILADRVFVAFCLATFLIALLYMQSMSTFPLYLQQLGFRPSTYGWIIAINGWLIVLLQVPLTTWLGGVGRTRRLVAAALLSGIGVGMHGVAFEAWQFAACVVIWTLGEMIQVPLVGPIVADLAPVHMRARYMGIFGVSFSGANTLAAPIGGLVLARCGAGYVWGAAVVLGMLAAIVYAWVGPHVAERRRTALTAGSESVAA
ncbi:MAG: MDR family MFS transporter [Phycisphaerae bacterium]